MNDKEARLEELKKKHERKIRRQENKEEKDKKDEMIKTLSENVQDLQNKLLYQQAEFANYKRRREEETRNMLKYQNYDMALEIITVVDSLERAINIPTDKLSEDVKKTIVEYTYSIGRKLQMIGLYNIQFIVDKDDNVSIIEVNPRSSRTVPFLAKSTTIPIANIATKVMLGAKLKELGIELRS